MDCCQQKTAGSGHQDFHMEYCQYCHSDYQGSHMECCQWTVHAACQCCHYCGCCADVHHVDNSHAVVMLSSKLEVNCFQPGSHSVVHQFHNLSEFALT